MEDALLYMLLLIGIVAIFYGMLSAATESYRACGEVVCASAQEGKR